MLQPNSGSMMRLRSGVLMMIQIASVMLCSAATQDSPPLPLRRIGNLKPWPRNSVISVSYQHRRFGGQHHANGIAVVLRGLGAEADDALAVIEHRLAVLRYSASARFGPRISRFVTRGTRGLRITHQHLGPFYQ